MMEMKANEDIAAAKKEIAVSTSESTITIVHYLDRASGHQIDPNAKGEITVGKGKYLLSILNSESYCRACGTC